MYAGITVDPSEAGGMREALQWVRGLPFGSAIFLALALGIFLFGGYSLVEAAYRRVGTP